MVEIDRRRFFQLAGGAAAATALSGGFADSIARAASVPASRVRGDIRDLEHIVVLMQENRSFDHYHASMRGVRGFGEPHPAVLPSGKPVWYQPTGDGSSELLPFHPTVDDLGAAYLTGTPHSWTDGHAALHLGRYDGWVLAKGAATMAYLERQDALFHYALADAFTICDAYYCSFIGNTDPNRYYMWTGWTGNDGAGGGPVLYNDELGYDWMTYPERLEAAGVSWKVYQDIGLGLDGDDGHFWGWTEDPHIGNYGDTSLLYFNAYRNAQPGDPLFQKARIGTNNNAGQDYFEILAADVAAGRLPAISYITAPEAFSEHSNWPTNYGAWYVSKVLDALTANPDVWSKTVLFITYDENDGFFDHLVPPHPNTLQIPGGSTVSTEHEFYAGSAYEPLAGHYGFGPRVPMYVVSPWSTGGWVCSETFDHTSILRFMERRFGVVEPQITPWRRAVAGDLTSAFDFAKQVSSVPPLPSTAGYAPPDRERHDTYYPDPPATGSLPVQEPGVRPARPIGYDLETEETPSAGSIVVDLVNRGSLGAHFQARLLAPAGAPHTYTVGAGQTMRASWPVAGDYVIHMHGPNGFFRQFAGTSGADRVGVKVGRIGRTGSLRIDVDAPRGLTVEIVDAYTGPVRINRAGTGKLDTATSAGWYDITVHVPGTTWVRTFAGHLESGRPSFSDPALGRQ